MPTLNWIGKEKVINHHLEVPYKVLDRKYSFDENGQHEEDNASENKIIRGDNLEALKALLPQYEGRIKCIYIDPPYNTAKSTNTNQQWTYNDNVDHPKIKQWMGKTVGSEYDDLSRHDKWLCMMYPRLKLLYKLLAKGGVIFISIDDNEQAFLRIICDEIFGKHNFLAQFVWKSDGNFDNQAKIKVCHEYILSYIRNPECLGLPNGIDPTASKKSKIYKPEIRNTLVKNGPKNPMSVITLPIGFPCAIENLVIEERYNEFPYYHNKAIIKNYKLVNSVDVESGWSSKNIFMKFINNNFNPVYDTKKQLTTFEITSTGAIEMVKKREKISHVLSVLSSLGSTQAMSSELSKMGIQFAFPKPVNLISYLIGFYCKDNDIVLDSFAGSGTTAHAVLNMNKADGKNRKFILVEMEDYAESITAKRIKYVIKGYADVEGTGGNFSFYDLGEPLLLENECLNENISIDKIREYIYFTETKSILHNNTRYKYYLGTNNNTAYYFYYKKSSTTTLNYKFLKTMEVPGESYVIYADICMLSQDELLKYNITFKKIPRDIVRL